MRAFLFCTIYFLDCSTVLWDPIPLFQAKLMDYASGLCISFQLLCQVENMEDTANEGLLAVLSMWDLLQILRISVNKNMFLIQWY